MKTAFFKFLSIIFLSSFFSCSSSVENEEYKSQTEKLSTDSVDYGKVVCGKRMRGATVRDVINNWISAPRNTSTLGGAPENRVNTAADFLGNDTSDPNAEGETIFSDPENLPTAIASILNHAQTQANFHPASDTPEHLATVFLDYIANVDQTPFFHIVKNEQTKQTYNSKNYNNLIDSIVSLYDGINGEDKNAIKDSIANMAKDVFSSESREEWKNLFSQSTIVYSSDFKSLPKLYIYYTTLHMKYEKKKAEVSIQEYYVNRTEYTILPDLIKSYAKELSALNKTDIDDWIKRNSSPEASANHKLCFDVEEYKEPKK